MGLKVSPLCTGGRPCGLGVPTSYAMYRICNLQAYVQVIAVYTDESLQSRYESLQSKGTSHCSLQACIRVIAVYRYESLQSTGKSHCSLQVRNIVVYRPTYEFCLLKNNNNNKRMSVQSWESITQETLRCLQSSCVQHTSLCSLPVGFHAMHSMRTNLCALYACSTTTVHMHSMRTRVHAVSICQNRSLQST